MTNLYANEKSWNKEVREEKMHHSKKKYLLLMGIAVISIVGFLAYSSVDNSLSTEDRQYIQKYLNGMRRLPENPTYFDELEFIVSVQRSVLDVAPGNDGIPYGQKREPKDLYLAKSGLCYDRSRVIEKILRYSGFDTRHISIYSTRETGSAISSLITPEVSSHAVTEVLTANGWLVVDSNRPFVSIDKNRQPIPVQKIKLAGEGLAFIEWNREPQADIYREPFTFIYGLYSRHGKFYPPYNFVPDIHYGEFIQNLF